jgi:hypothetical protein
LGILIAIILAVITQAQVGWATYHSTGRDGMYAAAGPSLRVGDWRGSQVSVQYGDREPVTVTLNDFCQCFEGTSDERAIDLSDEAWAAVTGRPPGKVKVVIRPVPAATLPPTDVQP